MTGIGLGERHRIRPRRKVELSKIQIIAACVTPCPGSRTEARGGKSTLKIGKMRMCVDLREIKKRHGLMPDFRKPYSSTYFTYLQGTTKVLSPSFLMRVNSSIPSNRQFLMKISLLKAAHCEPAARFSAEAAMWQ